jgi:hypothetical protein
VIYHHNHSHDDSKVDSDMQPWMDDGVRVETNTRTKTILLLPRTKQRSHSSRVNPTALLAKQSHRQWKKTVSNSLTNNNQYHATWCSTS